MLLSQHLSTSTLDTETSLVVQWLSVCAPNGGGLDSIPGQETKSLHAATKTWHRQKKKERKKTECICFNFSVFRFCITDACSVIFC